MVIYEISSLINYRIKWFNDHFTLVRQAPVVLLATMKLYYLWFLVGFHFHSKRDCSDEF